MRHLTIVLALAALSGCGGPNGAQPNAPARMPDYTPSPAQERATAALRQAIGPRTEIHMILPGTPAEVVCGYAGNPPPHTREDRLHEVSFVFDGRRLTTSRDAGFAAEHARLCPTLAVAPGGG